MKDDVHFIREQYDCFGFMSEPDTADFEASIEIIFYVLLSGTNLNFTKHVYFVNNKQKII